MGVYINGRCEGGRYLSYAGLWDPLAWDDGSAKDTLVPWGLQVVIGSSVGWVEREW